MRHRVGEIDKERCVISNRILNKIDCALSKISGESGLICVVTNYGFIIIEWQIRPGFRAFWMKWPHIIGIGNAIEVIEAML